MRETFRSTLPKWFFLIALACFALYYFYLVLIPDLPSPIPDPVHQ
jgi:hypothetical protein